MYTSLQGEILGRKSCVIVCIPDPVLFSLQMTDYFTHHFRIFQHNTHIFKVPKVLFILYMHIYLISLGKKILYTNEFSFLSYTQGPATKPQAMLFEVYPQICSVGLQSDMRKWLITYVRENESQKENENHENICLRYIFSCWAKRTKKEIFIYVSFTDSVLKYINYYNKLIFFLQNEKNTHLVSRYFSKTAFH